MSQTAQACLGQQPRASYISMLTVEMPMSLPEPILDKQRDEHPYQPTDVARLDPPKSLLREVPFTWALDTLLSPSTPPTDTSPPPLEASSDPRTHLVPVEFHPGLAAIHLAFVDHRPLVLSPDIVWMFLAQGAADHINANAETLRPQLVEHVGKIRLDVRRDDFVKGSPDNAWPAVVEELGAQVRAHIGHATHDLLLPAFSTTGPAERVAA